MTSCPQLGGDIYWRLVGSDRGTIHDVLAGYHLPPDWLNPRLIFDLGAYGGYTARDFAVRFPEAKIIAVEMDAENVSVAIENARGYPNIRLVPAAVVGSLSEGSVVRYRRNPLGQNAHCLDPDGDGAAPAISLRQLVDVYGTPDYIKMDIEGAELDALFDFRESCVISVECHDGKKLDVMWLLKENGYNVEMSTIHFSSLLAVPSWWGQQA